MKDGNQKQKERDTLRYESGDGRSGNSHVENIDQKRIEEDVEHAAESDPDHGEHGFSFPAPQVIQNIGTHHDRSTQKDVTGI